MYWTFAASKVTVSKLRIGLFYTNYKTQPTSSLYPSSITLMYVNINNLVYFLVHSCLLIPSLNSFLLSLSFYSNFSLALSLPFLPPSLTHTHTHTHSYYSWPFHCFTPDLWESRSSVPNLLLLSHSVVSNSVTPWATANNSAYIFKLFLE